MSMPATLAKRPQFRGLPIPWTVQVTDGIPDFKRLEAHRVDKAYRQRLCFLCGQSMGKEVAFVGGPASAKSRLYTDGPNHEACAVFAAETCPHLAGGKGFADDRGLVPVPGQSTTSIDRAVILITDGWKRGKTYTQANPPIRLRTFTSGKEGS
tara:strand:+ start:114 stop:572 length:459 start_codon:yes stop_codon:yes gene_type:complete